MRPALGIPRPRSAMRWLAAVVFVLGLIGACQELDVTAVDVMNVDVSPDAADVAIGQTQRFTATLTDAAGHELRDRAVTWSVADSLVATVDQAGQVRGQAPGQTTITATAEGRSGQAAVNVTGPAIASIVVTPPTATLRPGESLTLEATTRDGAGGVITGRVVAWSSNNAAVAGVDNAGRVTAGSIGEAVITASADGVSGSATITVSLDAVATVEVVPRSASVEEGGTVQLQPVLRAANGTVLTGRPVTWTTSDGATATVNGDGLVGGVRVGSATITATAEGQSGQSAITVTPLVVATVEVTPPASSVVVGKTVQLQATAKSGSGVVIQGRPVTWTSNAPAIADVTPQGLVSGQAPGEATISASIDGVSGTARVSVSLEPVATVEIVPASGNLAVGDTLTLTAITRALDGTVLGGRTIAWTTSDPAVATIANGGSTAKLEARGPGETTITATSEGQSGTARFTVVPKPVASVVVVPGSANIIIDDTLRLAAVLTALDGTPLTGRPVAWTTSDAGIATVDGTGLVKGIGAGIATITATSEGKSGQASITVGLKPVASLVLAPPAANLIVDETVQFTVTLRSSDGTQLTGRVVTWSSLNAAVADVDGNGLARARAPGTAGIVAQSEGKADTAVVTVAPKPVATVTVVPALDTLFAGETVQLSAELRAADNTVLTGRVVAWASSAPAVAQVDGNGVVNALSAGQATITATSEGKSGSATIVVLALPVASIEIKPSSATVLHPGTQNYEVVVRTGSGAVLTNRQVAWRSLDPSIATVTPGGGVALTATATSAGIGCSGESCTARIEASAEGVADTATLVVLKPIATITLTPSTATLAVGSSATLQAEVKAEDGTVLTNRPLNWSSSSGNVTVQATGTARQSATVQAVAATCSGAACVATVTATAEGKSGSATITVPKSVATVVLAPTSLTLDEGETGTLTATAKAADGTELTDRPATWSTSNAAIAEVTGTGPFQRVGEVRARSCPVGSPSCSATITATIEGRSAQATVTVRKQVANVAVEPSAVTLPQGATRTLKAVLTASDGTRLSRKVNTWRSSATAVADVDGNGGLDTLATVTAGATGRATITATSEGVSGTAEVTVVEAVASVEIQPAAVTLAEGAQQGIAAVVKAASGNVLSDRQVTWTTTSSAIATVTGTGPFQQTANLSAVKCPTGSPTCSATIRATADGVTGSAVVTVVKQVATVTVTPDPPPALLPGATVQLTATPRASDGTNLSGTRPVSWQTADAGIATVDDGLVRAVAAPCAAGTPSCTVSISATIDGHTDAVTVRVLKPVAAVQVSPAAPPSLYPGETTQLTAQLTAADGTDLTGSRPVAWTSNATGVAQVDPSGLVTAVGTPCQQGQPTCQALVTAAVEGVSAGVTVNVLKPVARVEVTPPTAILTVNGSQTFGATLYAADDTPLSSRSIVWTLEIPAGSLGQGTINPTSGNSTSFTGTQVGSVVLVATAEGKSGSAAITITP